MWHEALKGGKHLSFTKSVAILQLQHADSGVLAVQVSQELIRMAILWHEMWHEALEGANTSPAQSVYSNNILLTLLFWLCR